MSLKIINTTISKAELKELARERFGDMVKAVVDIERHIMAVGGELHADEESLLIEHGSERNNLWGVNLYPEKPEDEWIEFDSMINLRPAAGNRTRGVEDPTIREQIRAVIKTIVTL